MQLMYFLLYGLGKFSKIHISQLSTSGCSTYIGFSLRQEMRWSGALLHSPENNVEDGGDKVP